MFLKNVLPLLLISLLSDTSSASIYYNLIAASELSVAEALYEKALHADLVGFANKPSCKASPNCVKNLNKYIQDLKVQSTKNRDNIKNAITADMQKLFGNDGVKVLLQIYDTNVFKKFKAQLPITDPLSSSKKYPDIAIPINTQTLTNPTIIKVMSEKELAWLKIAVGHPIFVKFNKYLIEGGWIQVLERNRQQFTVNLNNPFE